MIRLALPLCFLALTVCPEAEAQDANVLLFDAIFAEKESGVLEAIEIGADPNARDAEGATALMRAVATGRERLVRALYAAGADPSEKGTIWTDSTRTAYFGNLTSIAAEQGDWRMLTLLIEELGIPVDDRERDPETGEDTGWTALQWAAAAAEGSAIDYLLQAGAEVDNAPPDQHAALALALTSDSKRSSRYIVEKLVEAGANPGRPGPGGWTPLHYAARDDRGAQVRLFLEAAPGTVDATNEKGWTPLMLAAYNDNSSVVQTLVCRGATVASQSRDGQTALSLARKEGFASTVKVLTSPSCDEDGGLSTGLDQALLEAAALGNRDSVLTLLALGADVEARGDLGVSALHVAARQSNVEVLIPLLDAGLSIDDVSDGGSTPLMFAAFSGQIDVVAFLAERGARVNAVNENGETVLMNAAWGGSLGAVRLLYCEGADPSATRTDGATAESLARRKGHVEIAEFLRDPSCRRGGREMLTTTNCGGSLPESRVDLVASVGHEGPVRAVSLSQDSRYIATSVGISARSVVRVWEAATGRQLLKFDLPGAANALSFSPDGRYLAVNGRRVQVRDLSTGRARCRVIQTGENEWTVIGEVGEIRAHGSTRAIAYSPDGRYLLTGSSRYYRTRKAAVQLWNALTWTEVSTLGTHDRDVEAVAFSPDGSLAAAVYAGGRVSVWDAASGRLVNQITPARTLAVASIALSRDNESVYVGLKQGGVIRVELASSQTTQRYLIPGEEGRQLQSAAVSEDGAYVVGAGRYVPEGEEYERGGVWVWNAHSGDLIRSFETSRLVNVVATSGDGNFVVAGDGGGVVWLWDGDAERLRLGDVRNKVSRIVPLGEGRVLLGGAVESWVPGEKPVRGVLSLWDGAAGREVRRFGATATKGGGTSIAAGGVDELSVTADGGIALTSHDVYGEARHWDLESGELYPRWRKRSIRIGRFNEHLISPDGQMVLAVSDPSGNDTTSTRFRRQPVLLSAESGAVIRRIGEGRPPTTSVAFSSDGQTVAEGKADGTVALWDRSSGEWVRQFQVGDSEIKGIDFGTNDGRLLSWSAFDVSLWETATGEEIARFDPKGIVTSAALSPSGTAVLTASDEVVLWDVESGRRLRTLAATAFIEVVFDPDGKIAFGASVDGSVHVWDVEEGRALARLVLYGDGGWAVVDSEGRFDASGGGNVEGLHWVAQAPSGPESIALSQLKDRYYDPGLLAKVLGYKDEPLRDVTAFDDRPLELHPSVAIAQRSPGRVWVQVRNRGGGIGPVVVRLNGKEVDGDARSPDADHSADVVELELDLSEHPFLIPGASNVVEALAYNVGGYLVSRPETLEIAAPEGTPDPPTLYAVIVGVSDYAGDALDLRFAAKDAEDFAKALGVAAESLFGVERTRFITLSTGSGTEPTKAEVTAALTSVAAEARPTDVLVVYLAGHGVTFGGEDGDFYFLGRDATSGTLADDLVREAVALSSSELTDLILRVPALKQVLILDTCSSGRVIDRLAVQRDVPGSQIRALERMKDRAGLWVLAGSAADAVSYEASRYGQGLLTYSLLMGMKGAALRDGAEVDVSRLFNFATDRVPELAAGVGGVQRPLLATPRGGGSFAIGLVQEEDKAAIPLAAEKPLVLRASFQESRRPLDHLGLSRRVNEALLNRSRPAGGSSAPFVYVDADDFPGAFFVGGRYRVRDAGLSVDVTVFDGDTEVSAFAIEGDVDALDGIAENIAHWVESLFVF